MIYIFLANGFEEVEAITPLDYLRRCEELSVKTVAVGSRLVVGSHKITIMADILIGEVNLDSIEMIVLPGGMPGTLNLEANASLQKIIDHCVSKNIPIAAICAAPSILGHRGLLDGKTAVCYPGFEEQLTGATIGKHRVEHDGNIITSRGPATAAEFSFKLIEVLLGANRAQKVKDAVLWEQ